MPKPRDVWFSAVTKRDNGEEFSKLLTEFLLRFAHQVVYNHGSFDDSHFECVDFHRLTLRRCVDHRVVGYIDECKRSLARWILHQRLKQFSVVLQDDKGTAVREFHIELYKPRVPPHQKLPGFDQAYEELKQQLRSTLATLQCGQRLEGRSGADPLSLRIRCTLVESTSVVNRVYEQKWRPFRQEKPKLGAADAAGGEVTKVMEPLLPKVDCDLAQLRFFNFAPEEDSLER